MRRPPHDPGCLPSYLDFRCYVPSFVGNCPGSSIAPDLIKVLARLHRTDSPSTHRHPRQRHDDFLLASAHSPVRLAACRVVRRSMRPIDVCFPTHSLRAPAPRGFLVRPRWLAPPLRIAGNAAFHDATNRFGGSGVLLAMGRSLPRGASLDRTSDTPVAPDASSDGDLLVGGSHSGILIGRQDRFTRSLREEATAFTTRNAFPR